jgi:hypothetical protein
MLLPSHTEFRPAYCLISEASHHNLFGTNDTKSTSLPHHDAITADDSLLSNFLGISTHGLLYDAHRVPL